MRKASEIVRHIPRVGNGYVDVVGPAITAGRLEVVARLREMADGSKALASAASGGKFVVSEEYEAESLALSRAADQLEAEIRKASE